MKPYIALSCVTVVAVWLANSDVSAQLITPVSQNRYVTAGPNTQTATNFGPFVANVSTFTAGSSGSANQNSQINASSIIASGGVNGSYQRDVGGAGVGTVAAQFTVTFTIAVPCSFTLTDQLDGIFSGIPSESFAGPTGTIFQATAGDYSVNGVLTPGEYVVSTSDRTSFPNFIDT